MINCIDQAYRRSFRYNKFNVLYFPLDGLFDLTMVELYKAYCTEHIMEQVQYKGWTENVNPVTGYSGDEDIPYDFIFLSNRSSQFEQISLMSQNLHCPIVVMDHDLSLAGAHPKIIKLLNRNTPKNLIFCYPHNLIKSAWQNYEGAYNEPIKMPYYITKKEVQKNRNGICIIGDNVDDQGTINSMRSIHPNHTFIRNHDNVGDIKRTMEKSEICLSIYPDFQCPFLLFEAASYGNVIITNRTRWSQQFFTHGEDALLFNDLKEMTQITRSILKNKDKMSYVSEMGRKLILNTFGKNQFFKGYEKLSETINDKVYIR